MTTPLVSEDAVAFWEERAEAWAAMAEDKQSFYTMRSCLVADLVTRHLASGTILDVGCGPGILTRELLRRGFDAYGADIAQAMVDAARAANGDVYRFRRSDGGTIPFDGTFNAITAVGVFPYARDYARLAADIRAHLRDGGIVVASCANSHSIYTASEVCKRLAPGRGTRTVLANLLHTGVWSGGFVDARDRRQAYTPSAFDRVLRAEGLARVHSISLYNWSTFDASPLQRGPIARALARLLGWTYIGVYRAAN